MKTGEKMIQAKKEKQYAEPGETSQVIRVLNWLSLPLQGLGSCLIYFIMEMCSRHSFLEAWNYMMQRPLVFLYNALIIFTSFTIVYLFRRRAAVRAILTAFWLVLGIVNGVILANRVTPFTGPDVRNLAEGGKIITKYLSGWMLIAVPVGILLLIACLIFLFLKAPTFRGKIRYYLNLPLLGLAVAGFLFATKMAYNARIISNYFPNIAFAYQDYGYPYCLGVTLFNTGISVPNGYSEELIREINDSKGQLPETDSVMPNIIFVQLESFFDPELVSFLSLSEDPIPNFHQLMKDYSSGYFRVPVVGAGTANTEFECISGMSLRYFGPGEYPYKTILKESTCESVPYVLKDLGYKTHAIHNNEANFYGRRTVFSRLGFDTFDSEEYMPNISDTTPTGWVKDHILVNEILGAIQSTEERDYIYTISVQGHGDYPTESILENPVITVSGAENREKNNASWEYYVNMIHEMDQFVADLVKALDELDEPTVLVMYGDHLPTMGLENADLENRYLYQTEYFIWDNLGLTPEKKNIASYQMGAEILNRVGIHEGNILTYHQTRLNSKNYLADMEVLQYDLLYGKRYCYNMDGETPYKRTNILLGNEPIEFYSFNNAYEDCWYFYGKGFTASSLVEVNGELQQTVMIDNQTLLVPELILEDGAEICIAQQSNSSTHKILSRTEMLYYEAPKDEPEEISISESISAESEAEEEQAEAGTADQEIPAAAE